MPFPNEHAARLKDPGQYDKFRRQNNQFGQGIHPIYGIKTKPKRIAELQAIRFDSSKFTVAEAKKWLKDHDHKTILFEPATGGSKTLKGQRAMDNVPDQILATDEAAELELIEAVAEEGKPKIKRFKMVAYTGGTLRLDGWPLPVVVDLEGLEIPKQSRPILRDHDLGKIVGHSDSIRIENRKLKVEGVISAVNDHAKEVLESSINGFPWQASIGAKAKKVEFVKQGKAVRVNGRSFQGPLYVARKSVLGEVSFVAVGADSTALAKIAAIQHLEVPMDEKFKAWLENRSIDIEAHNEDQLKSLKAIYEEFETINASDPPADPPKDDDVPDPIAMMRAAAADESKRIAEIHKLCEKAPDIAAKAISEGWDETKTELEVLRASRAKGPAIHDHVIEDVNAKAIEASLCMSAGIKSEILEKDYDEKTLDAASSREYRGASLHSLFGDTIRAAGGHVHRGRFGDDDIRAAFRADRMLQDKMIQAAGGFSTISLTGTLSNIANKTLLDSFTAVESVVGRFCAEVDHIDFKQASKYRITGKGVFLQIGPDGEIKHTELTEETFTNQIDTFGRIIALTRQTIINDDLGAFLQIPKILGRQAALARESAVFTLLLSNPGSFFAAVNNNYLTGATTILQISSLTSAEQLFLDQTDSDGQPILISPAILLVPSSLKVTAQQLMTETRVNERAIEDTATAAPWPGSNPHAGKWEPAASPYLNAQGLVGQSALAWYLFGNPADIAAMEIAYLRGARTPTIQSGETDFNTLGMQWRGYWDFGVAMQDTRGAVKVKGAA